MIRTDSNTSFPVTGNELPTLPAVSGDGAPAPVVTPTDPAIEPSLEQLIASTPATFGLGAPENPQDAAVLLARLLAALDDLETDNRNRQVDIDGENRSEALRRYREAQSLEAELHGHQTELQGRRDAEKQEIASLEQQIAATDDETERAALEQVLASKQAGLAQTDNELASNQQLLDAATTAASAFLLALLEAELPGVAPDEARQDLFDRLSEIGSDKIAEVLAKFDPPGIDPVADADAETRKVLELLAGSLVTIEATVQALREAVKLPPQTANDQGLRNQRRQLVL
jgi:hypothetical protein